MRKTLLILISFSFLLLSATPLAQAATGLSISPPVIELLVQPNKSILQTINLKNLGETNVYRSELRSLIPQGKDGGSTISTKPIDLTSIPLTITINGKQLTDFSESLQGGSLTPLTLRIETATTDTNEEFYLALIFVPDTGESLATTPIFALPILITLTPTGNIDIDLGIKDFDLPSLNDSLLQMSIAPSVENKSHFMLRPGGELKLTNPRGESKVYEVKPELVLGGSTRHLSFEQEPTLSPDVSRIGPYTYTLKLTTPGGKTILESSRVVWFLPIRLIIVFIVAICITLAILWKKLWRSS